MLSLLLLLGFLISTIPKHAEDMPENRTKEVGEVLLNRKLRKMKLFFRKLLAGLCQTNILTEKRKQSKYKRKVQKIKPIRPNEGFRPSRQKRQMA